MSYFDSSSHARSDARVPRNQQMFRQPSGSQQHAQTTAPPPHVLKSMSFGRNDPTVSVENDEYNDNDFMSDQRQYRNSLTDLDPNAALRKPPNSTMMEMTEEQRGRRNSIGDSMVEAEIESKAQNAFHLDFVGNLEKIASFLNNDVLGKFEQLLSMRLCPLQTPRQLEPHHLRALPVFQSIVNELLGELLASATQETRHLAETSNDALQAEMPNLDSLKALAIKYNRPQYQTKLLPLVETLQIISKHCRLLWSEREVAHKKVREIFERSMSSVCYQITKAYERLCPEIIQYIEQRVRNEKVEFHDKYEGWLHGASDQRKKFYTKVNSCTDKQVKMLLSMITIVERELLHEDSPTAATCRAYAEITGEQKDCSRWTRKISLDDARAEMKKLRLSLTTWQALMLNHKRVDSSSAILPQMLTDLQAWLLKFQSKFLLIIGEAIPDELEYEMRMNESMMSADEFSKQLEVSMRQKQPLTRFPSNSDQGDSSRTRGHGETPNKGELQSKSVSESSSSSTAGLRSKDLLGLTNLNPSFKEFLQCMQTQNSLLCRRHEVTFSRMQSISQNQAADIRNIQAEKSRRQQLLVERQQRSSGFADAFSSIFSVGRSEAASLEEKSKGIRQQLLLENRLQDLGAQSVRLQKEFKKLEPRIKEEKSIQEALKQILNGIHGFGAEFGEVWVRLIKEEGELMHKWSINFQRCCEQYLHYRNITREMVDIYIRVGKYELAQHIALSFADLNVEHQEIMSRLEATFNERRQEISHALDYVDQLHCQIEAEGLPDVSSKIAVYRDQINNAIVRKDQIDHHLYKVHCHEIIMSFIETLRNMLQSLFNDQGLQVYLARMDEICCGENQKGCAPKARPLISQSHRPHHHHHHDAQHEYQTEKREFVGATMAPVTWVQITEYPPELDLSVLLTKHHQSQVQDFQDIKSKKLYHDENNELDKRNLMEAASVWSKQRQDLWQRE